MFYLSEHLFSIICIKFIIVSLNMNVLQVKKLWTILSTYKFYTWKLWNYSYS